MIQREACRCQAPSATAKRLQLKPVSQNHFHQQVIGAVGHADAQIAQGLAVCGYFDSLKRQALAMSLTPSNVPLQLMYQFSLGSSSELGWLLAWVPYIHLVSLL